MSDAPVMTSIATPCIKICTVDPQHGLCIGCGRTLDEIGLWSTMSDTERHRIMATLPERLARLRERRRRATGQA